MSRHERHVVLVFVIVFFCSTTKQQCQNYKAEHPGGRQERSSSAGSGDHSWLTKTDYARHHNSIQKYPGGKPPPTAARPRASIFVSPNCTEVLAQIGTTAMLHCEVSDLGESTVTWIRKKDYQLLTVGLTTYSSDERFFTTQGKNSQDWILHLRFANENDAGLYECQISTHPPSSLFIELKIVEAQADIIGGSEKIVKDGSPLRLTCLVRRSTVPSAYLFWYHEARMINFDLGGGAAVRHGRHSSELLIPRAERHHAGNYTCVPSNARPASVIVHVLENEQPAAMQHGSKSNAARVSAAASCFVIRHYKQPCSHSILRVVATSLQHIGPTHLLLYILHTLRICR